MRVDAAGVQEYHEALMGNAEVLEWLRVKRSIKEETLRRFRVGLYTRRFGWAGTLFAVACRRGKGRKTGTEKKCPVSRCSRVD